VLVQDSTHDHETLHRYDIVHQHSGRALRIFLPSVEEIFSFKTFSFSSLISYQLDLEPRRGAFGELLE
jgi:hypothetical protein